MVEFGVNGDEAGAALFVYLITAETEGNAEEAWLKYIEAWDKLYIELANKFKA